MLVEMVVGMVPVLRVVVVVVAVAIVVESSLRASA